MEMLIPPVCFENPYALARPLRLEDAASLFEDLMGDPIVMKNFDIKPHTSMDQSKAYIQLCKQSWDTHHAYIWGVEHKASRRLIGTIKAHPVLPRVEVGMMGIQKPGVRHKRLLFDFFLRLLDWIIAQPSVEYVYAYSDPNSASERFVQHCQFQFNACLPNWESRPNRGLTSAPVHVYGMTRPFTDFVHFLHDSWFKKPELAATLHSGFLLPPSS